MGAEFTKAYAVAYGSEIRPAPYAVTTKEIEVETGNASGAAERSILIWAKDMNIYVV